MSTRTLHHTALYVLVATSSAQSFPTSVKSQEKEYNKDDAEYRKDDHPYYQVYGGVGTDFIAVVLW